MENNSHDNDRALRYKRGFDAPPPEFPSATISIYQFLQKINIKKQAFHGNACFNHPRLGKMRIHSGILTTGTLRP
ncbi:MAG: hypothetical protein LBK26_00395 [Rickettsiales bacterium]|nr:hypothetical protein [Rickettsiales bacterium]